MSDAADQLLFDRIYDVIEDGADLTHEHVAEQILSHCQQYREGCEQAVRDRAGVADALLAKFRAHPHFASILGNIEVDMLDGLEDEEYDGEDADRKAAYAVLYELLAGKPYEAPVCTDEISEEVGGWKDVS